MEPERSQELTPKCPPQPQWGARELYGLATSHGFDCPQGPGRKSTQMSSTQTDELITAQQYANEMGVTLRHVYQMRYLGTGPVSHIRSGRIVFRRSDIDAYHERQRARTLRGEGV